MEGVVQVISRETVKPSSQSHHHPEKMKISYLDQIMSGVYVPIIFFYQADESKGLTTSNHVQISQKLKYSLSNTLALFYPLAGRAEADDKDVVDCNDAGVEFIEARIHAHLMDSLKDHDMEGKLKQYLPANPVECGLVDHGERPFLLVQITFFDCGGIALGICFSHAITDCKSIMAFINAWASTCRSNQEAAGLISFNLGNYFPAREFSSNDMLEMFLSKENFITKRFVFDREMLLVLKHDAISSSDSVVKDPTRVELISAFILKHLLEFAKSRNPESSKTVGATHVVNLRGRKSPSQLLENVFGNCFMTAPVLADVGVHELHDLVSKWRSSIRKIDDAYITESQNGNGYLTDLFSVLSHVLSKGEGDWFMFTSWCGFPLYEADYGFGSPIWLCTTALAGKNIIILISNKTGDAIEVWVNMEQHNIEMLDNQINFLATTAVKDIQSSFP